MVFVVVIVALAIVVTGAVMVRRKTAKRGFSYVPDPNLRSTGGGQVGVRPGPGAIPVIAVPTPEFQTEEIAHDEFEGDVSDDLLDPRNPHHAEWVKEHPAMETDAEWMADHPEDNPS
jgi:hypothetical protein